MDMNAKEVTAIAIKFFGIWLIINLALYLPTFMFAVMTFSSEYFATTRLSLFLTAIGAYLAIGLSFAYVLCRLANSILQVVPSQVDDTERLSQTFVFQVLGVYLIVSGLPSILSLGIQLGDQGEYSFLNWFYLGGALFEFAVGVYLLVQPAIWALWLKKLRGR
ncbi:MAG: hypothetical protein ACI85Z_000714 [Rheinheimera aquimaris]|jgi:hypothetical protein